MKNLKKIFIILIFLLSINNYSVCQTVTLQQRLLLNRNDGVSGGTFIIDYEIKGTNLTSACTLGSLTCDITYDTTVLNFTSGTDWNTFIGAGNGYFRGAQSNSYQGGVGHGALKSLRVYVISPTVNANGGGDPPGYDLISTYDRVVRLNFTILNPAVTSALTVFGPTNQIGLFENLHNQPNSSVINDQILSEPIGLDVPLPVSLSSFNSSVNKNAINLYWKTASEVNNKEFQVERKFNITADWTKVATLQGKGNSSVPVEYSFIDRNLSSGKYSYRLKQIDNNGNFEYYSLNGDVVVGVPAKFDLSQNYPNPFNPMTKINFDLPKDGLVSLKIFDMLGREVSTLVNEIRKAGYYIVEFNASNLSSGVYFYRITAGEFSSVKKMIVLK